MHLALALKIAGPRLGQEALNGFAVAPRCIQRSQPGAHRCFNCSHLIPQGFWRLASRSCAYFADAYAQIIVLRIKTRDQNAKSA
jgi:hypothetical protein